MAVSYFKESRVCVVFEVQAVAALNETKIDNKVLMVCRAQNKSERIQSMKSELEKLKVCVTLKRVVG